MKLQRERADTRIVSGMGTQKGPSAWEPPLYRTGRSQVRLRLLRAAVAAPIDLVRPWTARLGDWIASSRAHRVICLVMGLWLINAFDVALTVLAHQTGVLSEENPIAARLLHSPSTLAAYKLVLVAFASTVLLVNRRKLLAEITAAGMLVIYGIVAVQWRVCYEIYALTFNYRLVLSDADAVDLSRLANPF